MTTYVFVPIQTKFDGDFSSIFVPDLQFELPQRSGDMSGVKYHTYTHF